MKKRVTIILMGICLLWPRGGVTNGAEGDFYETPAYREAWWPARSGDVKALEKVISMSPDVLGEVGTSNHGNFVYALMILLGERGDAEFSDALSRQTRECNLILAKYFLPFLLLEEVSRKNYPKTIELLMK